MKRYGVREICNVTFRATAPMELGGKRFFKGEPVLFFDSLKTSSLEGAATTVYATGGRGNSRLMSWDGEKTLTFTMEDALISADSLALLAAAKGKHYDATENKKVHTQKRLGVTDSTTPAETYVYINTKDKTITLNDRDALKGVSAGDLVYVLAADEGGFDSEPFLYQVGTKYEELKAQPADWEDNYKNYYTDNIGTAITDETAPTFTGSTYYEAVPDNIKLEKCDKDIFNAANIEATYNFTDGKDGIDKLTKATAIYLDYYTTGRSFTRLTIEPDSFGSNFYIEADTLFRDKNGADYAAIFTIPNCRVQSNFTITMASSGDPSSFQFTIDAFPGYTRFDQTKEVLAAIDIMDEVNGVDTSRNYRTATNDIEDTK